MLLQWLLSALWILFNILIELVPTSLHGSLTSSYTRAGNLLVPLLRSSFLPLHLLVLCMECSTPPSPGQFLLLCSRYFFTHSYLEQSSSPPVTLFDLFVFFTAVFVKLSCFHCLTLQQQNAGSTRYMTLILLFTVIVMPVA